MYKVVATSCACVDVYVQSGELHPGGEALNFCGNISKDMEIDCYFMGAIGDDEYGKSILDAIADYRIKTDYLYVREGTTANHKICLDKNNDRYFPENAWTGGLLDEYRLSKNDMDFIKSADAVHVTHDSPVLFQALQCRREADFVLAVDFNEDRFWDEWQEYVDDIDVFFISGSDDILPLLREWSERFHTVLVATLAARGSVAYHNGTEYRCEAEKVDFVMDTTGAGDSYQAGFVAEYIKSGDILAAMKNGSKMAAENISHMGGF